MSPLDRVRYFVITGCGLGLVPVAPGTFGTLPGVALGVACGAWLAPKAAALTMWGLALGLLVFGCLQTEFAARAFPTKDPGAFVLDEIVGVLVGAAIFAVAIGPLGAVDWVLCFVFFRVFDVTKLQPARWLEQMPGAPGIMLDDVAAGAWTGLALVVVHWLR